jgi:proteasome lid subunit RPN8/RPN11
MGSAGSVHIRGDVFAAITAHAQRDLPNECCGLLLGTAHLIDEALPAPNLLSSATRYQLDPRVHLDAIRRLRGTARAVVGAYHSHPRSAAVPSARDIAEAHYAEFVWLIVSLESGEGVCRAWRIDQARPEEMALIVER